MWNIQFRSYQDVKNVLHTYTYFISMIFSVVAYFLVIPEAHRWAVNTLFGLFNELGVVGIAVSILFGFTISFLFIHLFEIHDKIYDRFIIKWRYRYSRDFILPELFKPFGAKLDKRFFQLAEKNIRDFMKVFYHFVSDYDVKIRKTLVVRFYDRVWKYWATQVNEILIIMLLLTIAGYAIYYAVYGLTLKNLLIALAVAVLSGIVNRFLSQYFLRFVREATQEEIEDIHANFHDELEYKVKELSRRFHLEYGND